MQLVSLIDPLFSCCILHNYLLSLIGHVALTGSILQSVILNHTLICALSSLRGFKSPSISQTLCVLSSTEQPTDWLTFLTSLGISPTSRQPLSSWESASFLTAGWKRLRTGSGL